MTHLFFHSVWSYWTSSYLTRQCHVRVVTSILTDKHGPRHGVSLSNVYTWRGRATNNKRKRMKIKILHAPNGVFFYTHLSLPLFCQKLKFCWWFVFFHVDLEIELLSLNVLKWFFCLNYLSFQLSVGQCFGTLSKDEGREPNSGWEFLFLQDSFSWKMEEGKDRAVAYKSNTFHF